MGFFKTFWKGEESPTEHGVHIGSYHRYFEGYVEKKVKNPKNGRYKIVRVYTAPYRVRQGTDREWKTAKLTALALYSLSLLLLILSASVFELTDPAKYYQCFLVFSVVLDFYILYKLIQYLAAPRKMTIGEYKAIRPSIWRFSIISALCTFAGVLARVLNMILTPQTSPFTAVFGTAFLAGSGGAMLWFGLKERKTVYLTQDNPHSDENGILIQS